MLRSLALALLATALLACGGRQTPAPDDAVTDPVVLFDAMLTRDEAIDAVRLRATLEYYGEGGRARVEQAVLARGEQHLRMETISPFGTSLAVFLMNDTELVFFDLQEQVYVTGRPSAENVSRFVPVLLAPDDLVRVLQGGPPLAATSTDLDAYTLSWSERQGAYRLTIPLEGGGELVLFVRHQSWTVAGAIQRDADGDEVFELRAGDFVTVQADGFETEMPQRLRFLMPSENLDLSLDVNRVELNPTLPDALFELAPPSGASVTVLP